MMTSSFVSATLSFFRESRLRRLVALLLVSGSALATATAQVGLPRNAVSIPSPLSDQNLAASLQNTHSCVVSGSTIVLPPVLLQFGASQSQSRLFEEQARAFQNLPHDTEVWLHIVVDSGTLNGTESEKQVIEQVSAFLNSAPLSSPVVRGVIVEPSTPQKNLDLYIFGLLRLAVSVKSSNPALRLAFVFQPGFISQYDDTVKRLATYSDLLGTTSSQDWRSDSKWIAEHARRRKHCS
jgi:hypothetical protein